MGRIRSSFRRFTAEFHSVQINDGMVSCCRMRFCRISRAALVILLILSYSLTACAVTAEPEPAARPTTVTAAHPTMTLTLTRSPQLSPMLAQPTVTAATATTSATATPDLRPGAVTGNLCYPSSKPPPMTLYLKNTVTGDITAIDIAPGQTTFKVAVPPGAYVAYAHTVGTELAGGYTQISTCEDCGHDLRPFDVEPGATADGIDLCDWYDPPRIEFDPAVQNGASVLVTTLQNMNVFSSPTLASLDLAIVPPRTTVEAVARTADGAWLQAEFPHTGPAWIFAPLTQVKGQPGILPVATPGPALPTVEKKEPP